MSDGSKIEWTDATWNPITGCSVVSPGCTNCYAMRLAGSRLRHLPSRARLTKASKAGPVWTGKVRLNGDWITQPLRWKRARMIFVCAHSDLFHESVPDQWIDYVFAIAVLSRALGLGHVFQVLTKRAARMKEYFSAGMFALTRRWSDASLSLALQIGSRDFRQTARESICLSVMNKLPGARSVGWPVSNVWLGVSCEDQVRADERIPPLLATPAAVRWISAEPLLGPINLELAQCNCPWPADAIQTRHLLSCTADRRPDRQWSIDWVVAGGESGPGARAMHSSWARSLRDQCKTAGVPFFFKQWGEFKPHEDLVEGEWIFDRVGKKRAGRLLDGIEHNAFPEVTMELSQ